jgi:FkbM family methyltransferase
MACGDDPGWCGLPFGLGSEPGTATLNVFGSGNFNSLLPPSPYGSERFTPLAADADAEAVEMRRLDELMPALLEQVASPRVFLKIDAQGNDLDVVQGAAGVLPRIEALQLELSVRPCYEGQPALPEAIMVLADLHYELLGVFPVARDGLRVVEFDGVFCRSS